MSNANRSERSIYVPAEASDQFRHLFGKLLGNQKYKQRRTEVLGHWFRMTAGGAKNLVSGFWGGGLAFDTPAKKTWKISRNTAVSLRNHWAAYIGLGDLFPIPKEQKKNEDSALSDEAKNWIESIKEEIAGNDSLKHEIKTAVKYLNDELVTQVGGSEQNDAPADDQEAPDTPGAVLSLDSLRWQTEIPNEFKGSVWYSYENSRNDGGREEDQWEGLGKKVVKISAQPNAQGFYSGTLSTHRRNIKDSEGIVVLDGTGFFLLFICITKAGAGNYSHFMMRIGGNDIEHDLCLGHLTFDAKTKKYILTKSVIWEKAPPDAKPEELDSTRIDSNYSKVSPAIKSYLKDRQKVRLTSPKELITNEAELTAWLSNKHKPDLVLKQNFCGEFIVYYQPRFTSGLQKNLLEVYFDEEWDKTFAKFEHRTGAYGSTEKYAGEVRLNTNDKFLFISLDREAPDPAKKNETFSPVTIIATTPRPNRKFECLTGIMTGIGDEQAPPPVSYLVLLVKVSREHPAGQPVIPEDEEQRVTEFFLRWQGKTQIETPPNIFSFNNLLNQNRS